MKLKLNSKTVVARKLARLAVGAVGLLVVSILIFKLIMVLARLSYATLGFFENQRHRVFNPWGGVTYDDGYVPVSWSSLRFNQAAWYSFPTGHLIDLGAYLIGTMLFAGLGLFVAIIAYALFARSQEPPENTYEPDGLVSDAIAATSVADDDMEPDGYCRNGTCKCLNHFSHRPDVFINGQWEWQPSCMDPNCPCAEHAVDEDGDTFAPELIEKLTWGASPVNKGLPPLR